MSTLEAHLALEHGRAGGSATVLHAERHRRRDAVAQVGDLTAHRSQVRSGHRSGQDTGQGSVRPGHRSGRVGSQVKSGRDTGQVKSGQGR